jgi:hypothetical protein
VARGRTRRLQHRWDCWFGDRATFERALATFDEAVAGTTADSAPGPATRLDHGRPQERRGDWRTLLAQSEVGQIAEFTVEVPEPERADRGDLRLEFSRSHGVVLRAGSGSADAITGAVSALAPAVEAGVPSWSWVHSEIAELVAAIILGVIVELVWLAASHHFDDPDILDFLPLPAGILVAFGALTLLHRGFPRFRVREAARPDSEVTP